MSISIINKINEFREKDFFNKLYTADNQAVNSISIIAVPYSGKTKFINHISKEEVYLKYFKYTSPRAVIVPISVEDDMSPEDFYRNLMASASDVTGIKVSEGGDGYSQCIRYISGLVKEKHILVFIINKFERLTHNQKLDKSFFGKLRTFATNTDLMDSVAWVTTSIKPLSELLKEKSDLYDSDFYNIFEYCIDMELKRADAVKIIMDAADDIGYQMDWEIAVGFLDYFGRIPNILSFLVGHALTNIKNIGKDECYEKCRQQHERDIFCRLNKIWNVLDKDDHEILLNIDVHESLTIAGLYYKIAILEKNGLIEREKNGYKLSGIVLANWVSDTMKRTGFIPPNTVDKFDRELSAAVSSIINSGNTGENTGFAETDNCINILHLSDIHIPPGDANNQFVGLCSDLENILTNSKKELEKEKIHYLVVSGDIANTASVDEYEEAFKFINEIKENYDLTPGNRIILVPGNHDIDWNTANAAYSFYPNSLKDEGSLWEIPVWFEQRIGNLYCSKDKSRGKYKNFSDFYERIYQHRYPENFEDQFELFKAPDDKILFLCLNSCWRMDMYHKDSGAAGVNKDAFSNAISELLKEKNNFRDWLKIAVLHHPINGEEAINNQFLELLAQNGFKLIMHGHIHEAVSNMSFYPWEYKMHSIGAGTFGAPAKQMKSGIPLQYYLIKYYKDRNLVEVHIRKKEHIDGCWLDDARYSVPGQEQGKIKRTYYELNLV